MFSCLASNCSVFRPGGAWDKDKKNPVSCNAVRGKAKGAAKHKALYASVSKTVIFGKLYQSLEVQS